MSVVEVVRIACKAGKGDEFTERLKKGLTVQARDPGCISVWFQRCVERPDEFLLHLEWSSIEAHNTWRAVYRDEWRSHIKDLMEGVTDMIGHYQMGAVVKKA